MKNEMKAGERTNCWGNGRISRWGVNRRGTRTTEDCRGEAGAVKKDKSRTRRRDEKGEEIL